MSIINVNACCVTVAESYCLRSTNIFPIEISEIVLLSLIHAQVLQNYEQIDNF